MQYALVNNIKSLPQKGKAGICPGCRKEVIAKCGSIKVHHWAHKSLIDCDAWYEPETAWHREWKNKFPESYREVFFEDTHTGEYHRADIHTKDNITIEFQNSPISIEEFHQRNNFYNNLIWVVNGEKFQHNFSLKNSIPNPNDPVLRNFEISEKGYFKNEDILHSKSPGELQRMYGVFDHELQGLKLSDTHYAFSWKNRRKTWFEPRAFVFIDFGDENLYWLRRRDQIMQPFWYIQMVKKSEFIAKYS